MKRLTTVLAVSLGLASCSDPPVMDQYGRSSNQSGGGGGTSGTGAPGTPGGTPLQVPTGGTGTGGGGTGTGSEPTDTKNCGLQSFNLQKLPADLLLVLDRSGSMNEAYGTPATGNKWADATSAIDAAVMETQGAVQWGMKLFPGSVRCQVPAGIDVPVAANNYAGLSGGIKATMPTGNGTPTRMAITRAVEYLKTVTTPNPKYIVLATDGEPNCADDSSSSAKDAMGAINAVALAADAGFNTFVIGVSAGAASEATLNEMADKGRQARAGATKYYNVTSKAELVASLSAITGQIANCTFPLSKDPGNVPVAVNVGGGRVQQDTTHANGWDWGAGRRSIQLYGAACDKVKASAANKVDIIFGCPGKPIP